MKKRNQINKSKLNTLYNNDDIQTPPHGITLDTNTEVTHYTSTQHAEHNPDVRERSNPLLRSSTLPPALNNKQANNPAECCNQQINNVNNINHTISNNTRITRSMNKQIIKNINDKFNKSSTIVNTSLNPINQNVILHNSINEIKDYKNNNKLSNNNNKLLNKYKNKINLDKNYFKTSNIKNVNKQLSNNKSKNISDITLLSDVVNDCSSGPENISEMLSTSYDVCNEISVSRSRNTSGRGVQLQTSLQLNKNNANNNNTSKDNNKLSDYNNKSVNKTKGYNYLNKTK